MTLAFEAAVAGGIPVIKALREGLAGNRIERVAGILNGTCNYILTTMREEGRDFAEVLADAQALGYAEADPAFDIDGVDAAHKLAILAALAFGQQVNFAAVHVEGIRRVSALDISFAEELGYRIKLLGIARRTAEGVEMRVHPAMVPKQSLLAPVDGVYNAVLLEGDFAGTVFLQGRGAGAGPTASAVVADLIDIARGSRVPVWGAGQAALDAGRPVPISHHAGAYFLRLMVVDQPGVLADVTAILREHHISLASMLQHGRKPGEAVPIVLVTHDTNEAAVAAALTRIADLESVLEQPSFDPYRAEVKESHMTARRLEDVSDRNLALELVRVTEAAAIAASRWIGRGKKNEADGAAVEAMRKAFDTVAIDGTVVIGEGEMDEAPMLYIGEKVGQGGPAMDIAVDPLEGTSITAKGGPNAIATVALAEHGNFLHAPDIYMDKIAVGGGLPEGVVDLDAPVAENLRNLAQAKKMRRLRPGGLHARPRPPRGDRSPKSARPARASC